MKDRSISGRAALAALALLVGLSFPQYARAQSVLDIYPPWSGGANNPARDRGLDFTVPQIDSLADFHGSLNDPQLVIFVLSE